MHSHYFSILFPWLFHPCYKFSHAEKQRVSQKEPNISPNMSRCLHVCHNSMTEIDFLDPEQWDPPMGVPQTSTPASSKVAGHSPHPCLTSALKRSPRTLIMHGNRNPNDVTWTSSLPTVSLSSPASKMGRFDQISSKFSSSSDFLGL